MNTEDKIKSIISEMTGVDVGNMRVDENLFSTGVIDSLDHIEIIMGIEDDFRIEISDEMAETAFTISDLVNMTDNILKQTQYPFGLPKPRATPPMPKVTKPPEVDLRAFYDAAHELLAESTLKKIISRANVRSRGK